MRYKLLAVLRLLTSDKFHLVTEKKGIIRHANSTFQDNDYEWLNTSCDYHNDLNQQDENVEYFNNPINFIK